MRIVRAHSSHVLRSIPHRLPLYRHHHRPYPQRICAMNSAPLIFNPQQIKHNIRRSEKKFSAHNFLHEFAIQELSDRLSYIQKDFQEWQRYLQQSMALRYFVGEEGVL